MISVKNWLLLIAVIFGSLVTAIFFLSRPVFYADEQAHSHIGMDLGKFIGDKNFGGEFTLTRHDGQSVSSSEYKYKLIVFGFTHCPDVCPTTLKKITQAIETLSPEKQEQVTPILISVDPERDTPEVMKEYVSLFHPRVVGFTGSKKEIETVLSRYRVFAQDVMDGAATEYSMNHTSFIYFAGPDDEVIGVFMPRHSTRDIADSIKGVLN